MLDYLYIQIEAARDVAVLMTNCIINPAILSQTASVFKLIWSHMKYINVARLLRQY